jgi:hypothetical protein
VGGDVKVRTLATLKALGACPKLDLRGCFHEPHNQVEDLKLTCTLQQVRQLLAARALDASN